MSRSVGVGRAARRRAARGRRSGPKELSGRWWPHGPVQLQEPRQLQELPLWQPHPQLDPQLHPLIVGKWCGTIPLSGLALRPCVDSVKIWGSSGSGVFTEE